MQETTIEAIALKVAMGPFGSDIKTDNFVAKGVPVIRGQNLTSGRFNEEGFVYLTEEKANSLGHANAKPLDIVFTHRGTLGQVGIIPIGKHARYIVSQSQMKLEVDPKKAVPEYIYYYFKSAKGQHDLLANTSQTGVPAISRPVTSLKSIRLQLPSLPTQREIATILWTLDDKIELNRRMSATLEEMARALFKSWFIDFEPVHAKAEGRPTNLPPEIEALFPDSFEDSELGPIPKGWSVGSVDSLATVGGGSTPSTKDSKFWDGGISWATPKDLSKLSHPVLLGTDRTITSEGLKAISSGLYPRGSVLMSSRAPIGYLAINEIPVAVNQGFIVLKPKFKNTELFLFRWLEANMDQVHGRANGSTFMEISKSAFRSIPSIIPADSLIRAFSNIVLPMHSKLVITVRASLSLASLRDELLPKLISGELLVESRGGQ